MNIRLKNGDAGLVKGLNIDNLWTAVSMSLLRTFLSSISSSLNSLGTVSPECGIETTPIGGFLGRVKFENALFDVFHVKKLP